MSEPVGHGLRRAGGPTRTTQIVWEILAAADGPLTVDQIADTGEGRWPDGDHLRAYCVAQSGNDDTIVRLTPADLDAEQRRLARSRSLGFTLGTLLRWGHLTAVPLSAEQRQQTKVPGHRPRRIAYLANLDRPLMVQRMRSGWQPYDPEATRIANERATREFNARAVIDRILRDPSKVSKAAIVAALAEYVAAVDAGRARGKRPETTE